MSQTSALRHASPLILFTAIFTAASVGQAVPPITPPGYRYNDPLPAGAVARIGTIRFQRPLRESSGFPTVAFSSDGKMVLSVGSIGMGIWETATGKSVRWFPPGPKVSAVIFAPDGKHLWTTGLPQFPGNFDGRNFTQLQVIQEWQIGTGRLVHETRVRRVAMGGPGTLFSPDGTVLLAPDGIGGGTVGLWNTTSGERLGTAEPALLSGIWTLSTDGKIVAYTGIDMLLHIRDVAHGKELLRASPNSKEERPTFFDDCELAPDGHTAAACTPKALFVWSLPSGKLLRKLPVGGTTLIFSADGKYIAVAGEKAIHLLKTPEFQEIRQFQPHGTSIRALAFSADGRLLASGGGATVGIWDVATGRQLNGATGHRNPPSSLVFSPDGKALASAASNGELFVWDVATARLRKRLPGTSMHAPVLAFSPDGKILVTGQNFEGWSAEAEICFWDYNRGRLLRHFTAHLREISSLAFSPNGRRLASTGADNRVRVWDTASGKRLYQVRGPGGRWLADLSADGKYLLTGEGPDKLTLRRADTGTSIRDFPVSGPLAYARFLNDGRTVVSEEQRPAGRRQSASVQFWDMGTGRQTDSMALWRNNGWVRPTVSSDGRLAATAAEESNAIQLWDLSAHRLVATLAGHSGGVKGLAFSPDGKLLASGSDDTTILLWDIRRIELLSGVTQPAKSAVVRAHASR